MVWCMVAYAYMYEYSYKCPTRVLYDDKSAYNSIKILNQINSMIMNHDTNLAKKKFAEEILIDHWCGQ